ncbi:bacteriophage abortive infection AbiH family protein [Lactococcus cremoris]|uniref:bacteriophage abortive infection AbiH family protein n=1 Tax=Lactococcus lactis subsp. cremoris TaxID=1359 RepID=UPI0021823C70|nr:bacteriophage abortive infection AbiH family protein [Lactococcus cremoris]MCT0501591.1 hypothetical protein [Lactococcus cremoris]
MTKLIITGNGFDIAHRLKTQYNDFREYLESRRSEYTSYEDQIRVQIGIVQAKFELLCEPDNLWSDFETQTLKIINEIQNGNNINLFGDTYCASSVSKLQTWKNIRNSITNILKEKTGNNGLSFEMHEMVKKMASDIIDRAVMLQYYWMPCLYGVFQDWITTITYENSTKHFSVSKSDIAITFNYTDTLESLYGITDILHIHGSVSEIDSIVLGFHSEELDNDLPGLNEMHTHRFKERKKASRANGINSTGQAVFYESNIGRFYKPVHQLKNNINTFLENKSFEEVVVLGHSYNEIDWTYFKELLANYPNKNYIFTYYDETDKKNALIMINMIGPINKYRIVDVKDYLIK